MSDTWWCVWTGDTLLSFFLWLNFVYCRAKKSSFCLFRFPPLFFFTQLLMRTNSCLYVSLLFSWEMAAFWHTVWILKISISHKHPLPPFLCSVFCQVELKISDVNVNLLSFILKIPKRSPKSWLSLVAFFFQNFVSSSDCINIAHM